MATNNFIPQIWSRMILTELYKTQVYAQPGVVNRDYEGDIQNQGNSVKINAIGSITVSTYTKNTDMSAPEELDDAGLTFVITQADSFNFQVDDIDRVQQSPKLMNEAMTKAAYALADKADIYVAGVMAAGVPTANLIGSVGSPKTDLGTAGNAYDYLVALNVLLDENNVPSTGRFANVPPWFYSLLKKDTRWTHGTALGDQILRTGVVGDVDGLTVVKSNNVPKTSSTTEFRIIAGHAIATTYADQISQVKAYSPEKRFADAVKGLHVYDAMVVRPTALAMLVANRP